MHLDIHTLSPALPLIWDQQAVHDRIGIVLDQHQVEYGPEAVDGILACEVACILHGMGFDVRLMRWFAELEDEDGISKKKLYGLRFEGLDWDPEGSVGKEAMHSRWRAAYYPSAVRQAVRFTLAKDDTVDLRQAADWLTELISGPVKELVVQLEADRLHETTPILQRGAHPARL